MRRFFRMVRDAWVIAGVTLILVLLADAALKAWLPETGLAPISANAEHPPRHQAEFYAEAGWADALFKEQRQARSTRWTPYVYWRRQPFIGDLIKIDENGRRATWQGPEPAQLTLWVFGGSTVWGSGVRDHYTLPSAIARELHHRGLRATVVNYGESGYVSTQGLILLMRELQAGRRPDGVVFYDGVNDVYAALQSGQTGVPQNESERQADFRATYGLDNWLLAFPNLLEGVQRLAAIKLKRPSAQQLGPRIAHTWRNNTRLARALAQEYGFKSWFFWQPSLFAKPQRSHFEQRAYAASAAYHRDLQLAADTAVGDWHNQEPGVHDLSGLFADQAEPVFMDFCHLSEAGNAEVAKIMAHVIAAGLADDSDGPGMDNRAFSQP